MHLYALNQNNQLVAASHAKKQVNYLCLECGGAVRKRSGTHRIDHYFHLDAKRDCTQNAKSLRHLQTQLAIKRCIPDEEVFLEKRFPEIGRIADVCWQERKIIFEIQCSPISADEIAARNRDYEQLAYRVVWILHDHRYNAFRVSPAEHYLLAHCHYFTNIDPEGQGIIYDQPRLIDSGMRKATLKQLSIDVSNPMSLIIPNGALPPIDVRKSWKLAFEGDAVHSYPLIEADLQALQKSETSTLSLSDHVKRFLRVLFRPYRILFQHLLEKACR